MNHRVLSASGLCLAVRGPHPNQAYALAMNGIAVLPGLDAIVRGPTAVACIASCNPWCKWPQAPPSRR